MYLNICIFILTAATARRAWLRGATPRPTSKAEAGRTPCPKGSSPEDLIASMVRVGGRECQAATAQEQPRGATQHSRPGVEAGRTKPMSKELWLRGHRRA